VVLVVLASNGNADKIEPNKTEPCDWAECSESNLEIFTIQGMNFDCPDGTTCNIRKAVGTSGICEVCIGVDIPCPNFECVGRKNGKIGSIVFECPQNFECNSRGQGNCPPCIRAKCMETTWQCDSKYPRRVTVQNIVQECNIGTLCNKNFLEPCQPCILQTSIFNNQAVSVASFLQEISALHNIR